VGEEPDAPWVLSNHPRHASVAGFDFLLTRRYPL
jgi:hypothetical protein